MLFWIAIFVETYHLCLDFIGNGDNLFNENFSSGSEVCQGKYVIVSLLKKYCGIDVRLYVLAHFRWSRYGPKGCTVHGARPGRRQRRCQNRKETWTDYDFARKRLLGNFLKISARLVSNTEAWCGFIEWSLDELKGVDRCRPWHRVLSLSKWCCLMSQFKGKPYRH
jgi:hypothetical protein